MSTEVAPCATCDVPHLHLGEWESCIETVPRKAKDLKPGWRIADEYKYEYIAVKQHVFVEYNPNQYTFIGILYCDLMDVELWQMGPDDVVEVIAEDVKQEATQ